MSGTQGTDEFFLSLALSGPNLELNLNLTCQIHWQEICVQILKTDKHSKGAHKY